MGVVDDAATRLLIRSSIRLVSLPLLSTQDFPPLGADDAAVSTQIRVCQGSRKLAASLINQTLTAASSFISSPPPLYRPLYYYYYYYFRCTVVWGPRAGPF